VTTTDELLKTLIKEGLVAQDSEPGAETDLFDSGILDSLRMIGLIDALEQNYRIKIRDEDILPENFATLSGMAEYVSRRQAA